jgi:hypothetical protein
MQEKRMDLKGGYIFQTCGEHKFLPILCRPEMGKSWGKVGMVGFIIEARIQS